MQAAQKYIQSELEGIYPATEIISFSRLILEKVSGMSRTEIFVNKNTYFSDKQHKEIENIVEKLKNHVPIQYIFGETEFYGLRFLVNDSVLIPRPETEELVAWISNTNNHKSKLRFLDIGTGSGCIAISLKNIFPNSRVDAFDVSSAALKVAKSNALQNNLDVSFAKIDILNPPLFDEKWDVIVSNPPYVLENEKLDMLPNVLENEPHLALFVPSNDPLLFYRKIAQFAQQNLQNRGEIYFEINRCFAVETSEMLRSMGFVEIEQQKDISGNDRMVKAKLDLGL